VGGGGAGDGRRDRATAAETAIWARPPELGAFAVFRMVWAEVVRPPTELVSELAAQLEAKGVEAERVPKEEVAATTQSP